MGAVGRLSLTVPTIPSQRHDPLAERSLHMTKDINQDWMSEGTQFEVFGISSPLAQHQVRNDSQHQTKGPSAHTSDTSIPHSMRFQQ